MGELTIQSLLDSVKKGVITRKQALSIHLETNIYPPLPSTYMEPLYEAIELCEENKGDDLVAIGGSDLEIYPSTAEWSDEDEQWLIKAYVLVAACYADGFVRRNHDNIS